VLDSTFRLWLEPLRPVSARGPTLYLTGPSRVLVWAERRYGDLIRAALLNEGTSLREIAFVPAAVPGPEGASRSSGTRDAVARVVLNPGYTFERFVIGIGNQIAHGAALSVAERPGQAYNPLFLYGPPGLGKTHLLGAIANYLYHHSPELSITYTTAECFTNEFVTALQAGSIEPFKDRYRRADVLLIDDVQFLGGKARTAEEFFHTFNALYESGAQLVLSADRMPCELQSLAERLRDRFEWGLVAELDAPDLATRAVFVQRKLRELEHAADENSAAALAERSCPNLRLLEGALTRVLALSSLTASPLTPQLVEHALPARALPDPTPPRITVEAIQVRVCEELGETGEALLSPSRRAGAARARQLAMYLTRALTDLSLPEIAAAFNRRDHTTVMHAVRQVERRLGSDRDLAQLVGSLSDELRAGGMDRDRTD
jgi:chromosomal replication initiator protein